MTLAYDPGFFQLLTGSFSSLLRQPLVDPSRDATWLYEKAPFAVLAHTGDDPAFIYANRTAQSCFGYDWSEFIGMPSRLSAAEPQRDERSKMLQAVAENGFATGYSGIRVAKSGQRFWIDGGVVWNLIDGGGSVTGQAATFASWKPA